MDDMQAAREAYVRQLATQWEDYNDIYARLDSTKQVRGLAASMVAAR